jgi:glyoxylase-like metal-dependent hydrolase (beta-lactamase superfamily II)
LKIIEGVHQLEVPMERNPLGKTFSYLLTDSRTLIDTGVPTDYAYRALERQLEEHGLKPQDIERVILTHLHNDHIGLAEAFQEHGAELVASTVAAEKQTRVQDEYRNLYELTVEETRLFGGAEYLNFLARFVYAFRDVPRPLRIDRTLEDGETLDLGGYKLKVIWTPGHAQEHIVLHDPVNRLLFSGDHVLPKITSHVALHSYEQRDPLAEYLDSLDKVKDLDVETVLPGHEWTFHNLKERVEQLHLHHSRRFQEVRDTLKDGEKTVYQVGSKIHWDSRPWPEMSFWTKRMAATETYAHLVYLRNRGEVKEEKKGDALYYSLT